MTLTAAAFVMGMCAGALLATMAIRVILYFHDNPKPRQP